MFDCNLGHAMEVCLIDDKSSPANVQLYYGSISIVASKFLDSYQRIRRIEESIRSHTKDSFITPPGAPSTMKEFASRFYEAYEKLYPRVLRHCAELMERDLEDPAVKERAFDNARRILPAGTLTNLSVVGSLQDFRYLIQDADIHPNPEIRLIGHTTRHIITETHPDLIWETDPGPFEPRVRSLGCTSTKFNQNRPSWYVDLYEPDLYGDRVMVEKVFSRMLVDRYGMSWLAFTKFMHERGKRSVPKIFRSVGISFDIMTDYGTYQDFQRYMRCEQHSEPLTMNYGYVVPDDIIGTDMEIEYRTAMEQVHLYEDELVSHEIDLMQYIIPLGYLHRSVFETNLQEVYNISEFLNQSRFQVSCKKIAYEMVKISKNSYPDLMQWCRITDPNRVNA